MPVYNVEAYLDEAIQSVLSQSFTSFELILVNDGSTDGSAIIAEKYVEKDNRVKLLTKTNGGLSSARNAGLGIAQGEYIYFIDSDDSIVPEMLECLYEWILSDNVDIVAFTARPYFDNQQEDIDKTMIDISDNFYAREFLTEGKYTTLDYYRECSLKNNFVASACMYVAKKELLLKRQLNFTEGIIHEDELFTRQLLFKASDIYFLKSKFYNRRIRANSISTSAVSLSKPRSFIIIAELLFELNKGQQNAQLEKDSLYFFNWAIRLLDGYPSASKEYREVLKMATRSTLYNKKEFPGINKMMLKYKSLKQAKKNLAALRYKMGLGSRFKKLLPVKRK